ncbi:MAG: T9SS type A sorting domain-containing protein, partial [Bacteroidota bacterium]
FIVKFNSAGVRQWGTYMGGSDVDYCTGLACDANNNIIAGGDSYSNNLPVTSCAFQTTRKGVEDNWLGTFSPTGSIICLGYLGKPGPFETETSPGLGGSISVFAYQSHIVGYSGGQWPVTVGAYQTAYAGGFNDVDIAQLDISSCSIPSSNSNIVASTGCNCNGSVTVSLTATCVTPPYSYYYSNGAQTLNTAAQSNSLTNLCAGVYGYTVVPTSGGSIFGSFSIGGTTSTPTLVISPNSTICIGQSTTLTASGGSTYTWTASNGSNPPNSFSVIVTPTISTTYTVLSGTGTCTAHAISDVSVIPSITVVVSPTNYSICSVGLGVNITATGATSYTWSPSAGLSSIAGSLVTASPTLTTIYNVNGSAGSCNSSLNVTVTVKPSPAVSFSLQPDPTPHFWNIYPTYSGGTQPYSFSWNWGDGSPNDNTAYPSHTYSVAGTYSICIAITDANGCTASYCLNNSVYRLDHTNTMIYINVVNTVTGIKQNANLATLISINPNPANELFKIETNLIGIKTVELFDMNGKLVLSNPITNNGSINVAELSEGLYILTIKLANNVINKKVVIVR